MKVMSHTSQTVRPKLFEYHYTELGSCGGTDAFKAYAWEVPPREFVERQLTNTTYHRDVDKHMLSSAYEANFTPVIEGSLGPMFVTIYKNGRMGISGSHSRLLDSRGNVSLSTTGMIAQAHDRFFDTYGFDIRHWTLTSIEVAFNFFSHLSISQMLCFWGAYRGSFMKPYCVSVGKNGGMSYGTAYCNVGDPFKLYNKSNEMLNRGVMIVPSSPGMNLFRLERTFKTSLNVPDRGNNNRICLADLEDVGTYTYLQNRFVRTVMDVDKNLITAKDIAAVKGKKSKILSEREIALQALSNLSEASMLPGLPQDPRQYLKRLQMKHGDLLDKNSFWGGFMSEFMSITTQYAPKLWERFLKQW